jgi:hypothetical protein
VAVAIQREAGTILYYSAVNKIILYDSGVNKNRTHQRAEVLHQLAALSTSPSSVHKKVSPRDEQGKIWSKFRPLAKRCPGLCETSRWASVTTTQSQSMAQRPRLN